MSKILIDEIKHENFIGKDLVDFENMIASTPSCLKIISSGGLLINMNKTGLTLIEADNLASVLGANVYDIVEESHRDKFIIFNNLICSGKKGTLIFEIIGLRGTRRWMETYATPYKLNNGEWAHIAITNDISEKVTADKLNLQQKQALEETSRLATLGVFVSGIAHEINNPLAIIAAQASLLHSRLEKNKFDHSYFKSGIENIEVTIFRISKIINCLKALSRDPSGIQKKEHNLLEIVNDTLTLCREKFRLNQIYLTVEIPDRIFINCNNIQISQVLMNLLNNSTDAILNLKVKWVKIEAKITDNLLNLSIEDSGQGIPKEIADKMFDPFYTTKDVGQGTGIGLSICVGILKDHNGEFMYCKGHKNTKFLLKFPNFRLQNG